MTHANMYHDSNDEWMKNHGILTDMLLMSKAQKCPRKLLRCSLASTEVIYNHVSRDIYMATLSSTTHSFSEGLHVRCSIPSTPLVFSTSSRSVK